MKIRILALLLAFGGAATQAVAVGSWETLAEDSAAPLTVALGDTPAPWKIEVSFSGVQGFDALAINNCYPQLVGMSDELTSVYLAVNGWENSRDLFLTGNKNGTQAGTPLGNVNGNNDVGNGELWAPTNGVITILIENDGTHLTIRQNGHKFIETDKNTASGRLSSVTLGGGLNTQLGGGKIASARIWRECFATVVRAHPRLTAGLERESLIGMRFAGRKAGALGEVAFRFDLTNCTARQISDVRLWRQKHDPVPFAFFERDAIDLTANGFTAARTETDGTLTVTFAPTGSVVQTVYPQSEGRAESDYLWVTAKVADDLAADAEIRSSFVGDTVALGDNAFTVTNGVAKAPHRPFPYKYHIGAYVRQDRLVGNGSTTSDIFSSNAKERFETLTDVLPIYSAHDGYANGQFYVSGWSDGDTASTKRIVEFRNKYNPGCMVRPSLVPNNWVSANGIYGLAFEVAGAAESTRRQFASNIVEFLEAQQCDGLDIDYEWVRDGTNHREWQNIGKLLRELSEQFFDHGFVLSFAGRSHDSTSSGMPYNSADYGAFHACDFIMSQTYGGGWLNSAPCIQRRGLAVCTSRGLPARRVVLGQAAYVSADGHPGWDGASYKVEAFTSDPLRRFDIDTWWKSPYTSYWPFEGPSSLQAQCMWVRRENIGGVMSWGYYTDPTWDGWSSFGRHTSKAVWPMPWCWPTPEVEKAGGGGEGAGDVYLLKSENDWFWLAEHPGVKARFENDITLAHDPLVIDTWTGEIDGADHRLVIAKDTWIVSEKATGLIRMLKGTVKNLTVELDGRVFTVAPRWNDATADPASVRLTNTMTGENPIGVIAAEVGDGAVIENVHVVMGAGSEVKGVKDVGGLVGRVAPAASAVIVTNSSVTVGGKLHIEIRNIWDTLFQPSSPSIGAVVGRITPATAATIATNAYSVVAGGEIQDLAYIPAASGEIAGAWREPTGFDWTLPRDIDIRSEAYAIEVELELPQFKSMTFGESYPQLVRLVGGGTSVALGVSTAGGCELFLTGDGAASYAYPISRAAIRGNGDVGSGVGLSVGEDGRVKILIENRQGELRVCQNGETILVTDKNTSSTGYVRSALVGGGIGTLGGGRIVSVRVKTGRSDGIVHPAGYGKLVFDEEFDGTALDGTKWEKVPDDARHIDWKKYTSHREDLVAVSNGCLVLTGVLNDGSDGDARKFLCGQIQSSGKFNFRYGVIEIRAKFEDQDGAWPAMWMMPQNSVHGVWPQSGEIDITERLDSDAKVYQTAHFGQTDTTSGTTAAIDNGVFNVYRLEWTEGKIIWYVNGVATHSYSDPGTGYLQWPFDSPYYVILSQQLEGSWVGTVDDTSTLPVRMYVDYVRVWQRDDDPRKNAYLWLDAENTNTIRKVDEESSEIEEWQSDTLTGEKASKYTLSSNSPKGPELIPFSTSTSNLNLVSFGSTSNDCDLAFTRATDLRTIVMVAKVEQSGNAFLLGDSGNYDFHRGANGEWWASGNANANILNGQTYWNGERVANPASAQMPDALGLIEVHAAGNVTASQICYDRAGNGSVPRRGGKDVAELVLFKEALGYTDRLKLRKRLIEKWMPDLAHPNWSISDDWVLRRENDYSAGVSVAEAFADGAGTYEFKNLRLTGGLQSSSYTLRVQIGDAVELSGDTLNGRCCLGFDVRGGSVTFPACAATWYEHTTFRQTGGTVTSLATSTAQDGSGDGFMLGFNGKTMTLDIAGGTFSVPNSSLNFYDPLTMNVGGTVRAKGMFRSSGSPATVNVNAGGRLEIGALGMKASTCALNLKGGTLAAFEDGAAVHDNINLISDSTVEVPAGMTLTLDGTLYGDAKLSLSGAGTLKIVAAVTADDIASHIATAVVCVPDNFPAAQCEIYLSCAEYYAKPQEAESFTVRDGVLYATPPVPDIRASAYLWLDASQTNTMTFAGTEITEWRSVNSDGVAAKKYTLSSQSPSGPVLGADGLVSFGSTSANRDLNFTKSTAIRTVFMVAKIEQSANAFFLGDDVNYDFHRGNNATYWHSSHGKPKDGTTYWNGTQVDSPTTTTMPNTLGLITVETAANLTASQLCYDRAGNGNTPRRGGKDIAELLIFEKTLTADERRGVEAYLMAKWGLNDCQTLMVTGTPAGYVPTTNLTIYGATPSTNGTLAVLNTFVGGAGVTLGEVPDVKRLDLVFTMATALSLPGGGKAAFTIPSGCSVTIGDGGYLGTISAADATSELRYTGETAIEWPFADKTAFAGVIALACPLSNAERLYLYGDKSVVFEEGSSLSVAGLNLGNENGAVQRVTIRGGDVTVTGCAEPTNTSASILFAHWPSRVDVALEGGTFTARNAATALGWDGHANLAISGGRMSVKGLLANRVSSNDNTSSVTLSGGELSLGEDGIDFTGRGDRNASFTLAGGVLSCYADAVVKVENGLSVTAASALVASNATLSVFAPLAGSGDLTLDAPNGTIALYDISAYKGAFATVTDGTRLYLEVRRTAEQIDARTPFDVVALPDNVSSEQCTVKIVNSNTGRKVAATVAMVGGTLVATPEMTDKHLTYTPREPAGAFAWDGADGAFDGETFSDFDSVTFRRVVSNGVDYATLVTIPDETWAGDLILGGTLRFAGAPLHAKNVAMSNACVAVQSLVADTVAVGTNCTILAAGTWNAALSTSCDTTLEAVQDAVWTLASTNVDISEGGVFNLSNYAVRTAGRHYIVKGSAAAWPTSTAFRVVGDLPLYKDDAGYFTEQIVSVTVTNGEMRVAGDEVYDNLTVNAGGTLVWRGTTMTVVDAVTFDEGARTLLYNADGSKIEYRTGLSYDIVTAKTITGTPANAQDFSFKVVDNADGTQTLRATRNLGSARVVRAHPLLTRGVGQESLVGIDFSGTYGGNVAGVTFRLRLENMTADDIGNFKLWRMPYGTPYAFYAPSAKDLSSDYAVSKTVSADGREVTLAYAATGDGIWIYPEMSGLRDCSDRLWLTAELQNLKTLSDDARIYADVQDTAFSLGGNVFKVENGIATAPHRLYPWRYLVTAYMRRDRISSGRIGMLSNVPEKRWPSLTHVIISSFNVQYNWGTDAMSIYWDDNATGAFQTLRQYRDQYHPKCRLVPSLTKGGYVSLDSQQTGTAANRYAIAHAGEKKYRAKFVKYLVAKMEEMGADGLDIDWEYPDDNGKDYNAYGLLMRDLAEAFFDHGWDLSMCSNLGYRMPGGAVMAAADYMSSMAYGANRGLHAMNTTSTTAINVLTSRNVPPRRIVIGQAIYSTAKWHMGWDELAGRCGNDDDIVAESWSYNGSSGSFIGFTGPTTYRAKCNRARGVYSDGVEYGGVMSWGYYCDTGWWGGKSLGWNQRQTIWPRPYNFGEPEIEVKGEGEQRTYILDSEDDWHWFEENAASVAYARLAADITFDHDPKPISSFAGVLDGGGHTLTIPAGVWVVAYNHTGLFQSLSGTVKNLNIDVYGRFVSRNDRLNDMQSGWTLSAHGGGGANGAVLAANASAGARIEGVSVTIRPGAEVRANHDVGVLVGELWTGGAGVVVSNCTVDCAGTVWTKAVDSVNAIISTGSTGDGRVGLLVGSLNFGSGSTGVTLVDCSARLQASGVLKSVCGNNRSLGGLVGNVHVGTNAKFVWSGLRMTYDEGTTVEGPANSSRPYVCQPFFGYWYATATSSSLPTLDAGSVLVRNGYAPTGFDSATWLTAASGGVWTEGVNPYAGEAPVMLDEPFTNAVSTSYLTVGAVVDVPGAAGTNDLIHAECTGGFAIWVQAARPASASCQPPVVELRLGNTQSGKRADYGVAVRVMPGAHAIALSMSAANGTTLYVDGSSVQTVANLKFSSNPFVRADIGYAGVGLYACDILPNCIGTLAYPHAATYPEFNDIEIGADDDPLKLTGITYPASLSAATLKSIVAPGTTPGPLAAWYVNRDAENFVIEAYRNNETNTAIAWRNAGEATRNYAEQTTYAIDNTGTKALHFTHSTANGGAVAFNTQYAVSSAKTKWGGSTITGAALGLTAGTVIGERSLTLGSVTGTDTTHPLDGLAEEPSWYPSSSEAMRAYFRDAVVDGRGTYEVPPTEFNGEERSGRDSARLHYFYGDAPTEEAAHELKLDAPLAADGTLMLGLAGENPFNAALQLQTREGLGSANAWKVAAELPAGSSDRTFVLPMALDVSFYRVALSEGVTTQAAEAMPIVSTTMARANLGNVTAEGEGLVVQLEGSGVAEGMYGYLSIDGVAYVARVDAVGRMTFDLSEAAIEKATSLPLTLVVPVGATNGTIRVASPAVSAITYPDALVTEMVANTLYADGLTAQDYGWAYRIPSLVTDGAGEVLCCYDVRYGGGDLGTGSGIDIGETYSADFGKTFAKPYLAIDVPNTCNEKNVCIPQSRTNDLGDVATLYDPATETYWLMGMGGRGLNCGDYSQTDVILYRRGKGEGKLKWQKVRSVQAEIAAQPGIANASGGYGYGFLQGPGHGFVTAKDVYTNGTAGAVLAMPKGTLVFPMQYFVDSSFTASSAGAVYSTDHGETWTATRRSATTDGPQENCIMELDDGSWYMTAKAGYRSNNEAETGKFKFFRSTDYQTWTAVGERAPVPCQQGSCLRLGTNAADGKGRYVFCHTLDRRAGVRSQVALVFGADTTAAGDEAGIAWDYDNPLMLYLGNTGFKGYNSLCMVDKDTLGVLYEAQGHIYFIRVDVGGRLR